MNLRRAGMALTLLGAASDFGCGGAPRTEEASAEPAPTTPDREATEPACEASWRSASVADGPLAGPALTVDAADRPHVAFTRSVQGALVHATPADGGAWTTRVVTDEGSRASIAAGSERVWISYFGGESRSLQLARRLADGRWESSVIEAPSDGRTKVGVASSIAVSAGTLHVVYYVERGTTGELRHATRSESGGQWTVTVIDDAVEEVDRKPRPQLVAGPAGEAHVVHVGSREEDPPRLRPLLHAHRRDGSGWQATVIDRVSSSEIGFEPALAIDEQGALHVTYHAHGTFDRDRGFTELRHATRRANGSWEAESWDWPAHVGGEVPVVVDAGGQLHVLTVGVEGEVDRIEHAMEDGGSWLRSTVAQGVVRTPRVALGPDGAVHAIYVHDRDLAYAVRAPCAQPDPSPTR